MDRQLRQNLINQHGEAARQWLAAMPKRLQALCAHYQLSDLKFLEPLTWHVVATATDKQGQTKVLKLGMDSAALRREEVALSAFAGKGAIALLASGDDHLLLEYANPGQALKSSLPLDNQFEVYPSVMQSLHQAPSGELPHLSDWLQILTELTDPRVDVELLALGLSLRDSYLQTMELSVLCHGDLHANNILLSQRGWLAIDPKGLIADKAFELSALELFDLTIDQQQLITYLEKIADINQVKLKRLTEAFYLRALLSAAWFIEDGGSPDGRLAQCRQLRTLLAEVL